MSRILSYSKNVTELSSMDGSIYLDNPLSLNGNTPLYLKLIKFSISSYIPNVYNYGGVNNALVRCSKDNGVTWDVIQLSDGVYTIPLINSAIQSAISTYWTDPSDPGFFLRYNTATYQTYISIDSSKLAVPSQFCIDFNYNNSRMYELLGFITVKSFNTDGNHIASDFAKIDWFGNNISVQLNGFGPISILNGKSSLEICNVPLSTAQVTNEYVYPLSGLVSPWIIINSLTNLAQYSVKFVGEQNGQVLVLQGSVNLIFELSQRIY